METSQDKTRRSGGHARSGPLLRTRDVDAAPPRHRAPDARSREGTRARSGGLRPSVLAAGAAGVAVLLAAGATVLLSGDDASPRVPAARAPAASSGPTATPTELPPSVLAATGAGRTPEDARAALEEMLTARAEGNLVLLRATWEGDEAAAAQGADRVAGSSAGLSAVLTAWFDDDLATRVVSGLDGQSEASRAYAAAVAADDVAAADQARGSMGEVSRALGLVLADVTEGRIADYVPPQDAAQYRAFVDALEADDDGSADAAAAWLRGRLAREGAALAVGLS